MGDNRVKVQQVKNGMVKKEIIAVITTPTNNSWLANEVVKAIQTIIIKIQLTMNRDSLSVNLRFSILNK